MDEPNHKKYLYIGLGVCILFLALITTLLLRSQSQNPKIDDSKNVDIRPTDNYLFRNPAVVSENNPLISNKDLERVKEKFDDDLRKFNLPSPTPQAAQYKYKLSPQLKNGSAPSSSLPFHFIKPVFAAGCTETTAPVLVDVHKLKIHIQKETALAIAKELGVESYDAYATPSNDGGFSYFLVNPKEPGSYVILSENNGNFLYHHAITQTGDPIDKISAEGKAKTITSSYSFLKNLEFLETLEHLQTPNNAYSSKFFRDWTSYDIVNRTSIDGLQANESVCDIQAALDTNNLQVDLAVDGVITNINSKVKLIDKTVKLPSISLEKALAENPDSIIAPFAFGDENPDIMNDVTIDESVLAYIDIGMDMPQCAYAPTYITSGKTQSGKRVVAVFPAVSKKDLDALCSDPEKKDSLNIKEGDGSHSTVQYKTYTVPTPTLAFPPGGFEKCFGNQIDYLVDCRDNLNNTCNVFLGVPYKDPEDDPFNVCKDGPRKPEEFLYTQAGGDTCKQVLLDVNKKLAKDGKREIPLDNYTPPQTLMPSGNVTCHFTANPC